MRDAKETIVIIISFFAGVFCAGYLFLDSTSQAIKNRDESLKIIESKDKDIILLRAKVDYFNGLIAKQKEKDRNRENAKKKH